MAAKIEKLERVFEFNGTSLPDPGEALTVDEVKAHYANTYPELLNSTIKGPTEEDGKKIYEFNIATGTKG
jgi:PRTRC genetic system protein C